MGVKMSLQASENASKSGRVPVWRQKTSWAAAVEPSDFVVRLQARRQHGLHLPGLDPGRLAHLAEHPLETEIDEHLAQVEVDEFGCHGGESAAKEVFDISKIGCEGGACNRPYPFAGSGSSN